MTIDQKILSDITVHMKYAKYIPELNRRETWKELVDRNKSMHLEKFPDLKDDIEKAYKLVYEKKILPSMRSLQFAGKPITINPTRIYNCFKSDTKFITSTGVKSFDDFNDGDTSIVLSPDGTWQNSVVRNYGKQQISKLTFKRGKSEKIVYATSNHRWLLSNGSETTSIKIGDKLLPVADTFSNFVYEDANPIQRLYWAYGYVFGDGTRVRNRDKEVKWSMVRLCGDDKNKYLSRFEELGFASSSSKSLNGDVIIYTGNYLKDIPNVEDGIELMRAFSAGYMDADGSRQYDTSMVNKWKGIQSSDTDHIDFIDSMFECIGLFITRKEDLTGQATNYGIRPETYRYGLYHTFGNRPNSYWVLRDIEQNVEFDDVWCLEVENTHAFVLSGGLSTGNCAYIPVDDWQTFQECMFLLLSGTGVGFSVQFHHVEKLPDIQKPRKDKTRRWLAGDSIEGWADCVKMLMKSYFFGGPSIRFDFSDIRPKGTRLITSGGKAPGPQPLKEALIKIEGILENKINGDKLTPIECHDIICHIADAVLTGGIRRAALISLFNADDNEMISCKSGNWWELNPQRGRANNSAVLVRHKLTEEYFFNLWERIKASGSGEPGVYLSNDKDYGTNPSLRAGTKVLTEGGIYPIEKLADTSFRVPNLNGNWSEAKCWKSGTNIPLWKLTFDNGATYYSTAQHEWPINVNGRYVKCSTDKLVSGDMLPINVFNRDKLHNGTFGNYDTGFMIGWLYGDGSLTLRNDTGKYVASFVVSKTEKEVLGKLLETIHAIDSVERTVTERDSTYEFQVGSKTFIEYIMNVCGVNKKEFGLPDKLWTDWCDSMIRGFVDGLFSADGHVPLDKHGITLTSAHDKLTSDIQELLGFYGIKSKITNTQVTNVKFPNGTTYNKTYNTNRLRTTLAGRIKFSEVFKLSVLKKQNILATNIGGNKNTIHQKFMVLKSVELTDLHEDVWDISVKDDTHCFHISQVTTGNCCEISLRPYSFCNLCEVNVSDVETQEELNERTVAASFIGTLQASYTDFHYLRPIWKKTTEKDALIGVGMTGIGSGHVLNLNLKEASKLSVEENKRVASILGIKSAARTQTVKPSGTSSLVLGTSSGIHAWHNDYYLRRIRVNKTEAIYTYFSIYHPELIEDEYFRPHDTAVIQVPQKAPEGSILRTESPIETLERVKWVYKNWIKTGHNRGPNTNNVSATISIKDDEWETVGEWMWDNKEFYNGISVLPYDGGTYIQAPFEDIDFETWSKLKMAVTDIDLTKVVEMTDETNLMGELACAGGNCIVT